MCIRRTRPSLNIFNFLLRVAKKSEVHICSARTFLTYPSCFCQAGIRTRKTEETLDYSNWKKNKHELQVNTPSPNTHRLLLLQISQLHSERRQYLLFLIVPVLADQLQYYWQMLHFSRFLYSSAKTLKIVAGRRFWRFLAISTAVNHGCACPISCYSPFKIRQRRVSTTAAVSWGNGERWPSYGTKIFLKIWWRTRTAS